MLFSLQWANKERVNFNEISDIKLELHDVLGNHSIDQETDYETFRAGHNLLIYGDNKEVLKNLIENGYKGKVDLIYIDPPFLTNEKYFREISLRGNKGYESKKVEQYNDHWEEHEYFQFIYERLLLLKCLLSEKGSIYLHCDSHASHYLKLIMDEVFGHNCFRREIIWKMQQSSGFKTRANNWIRNHDILLYYGKKDCIFNKEYLPYTKEQLKRYNKEDEEGKYWFHNARKQRMGKGLGVEDVWTDIHSMQTQSISNKEKTGYPTQKPEALIERIIKASSNIDSIVLDCFSGSGTVGVIAEKLYRRCILIDQNKQAIQTASKRLYNNNNKSEKTRGFSSYYYIKSEDSTRADGVSIDTEVFFDSPFQNKDVVEIKVLDYYNPIIASHFGFTSKEEYQKNIKDSRIAMIDYILLDFGANNKERFFHVCQSDIPKGKDQNIEAYYIAPIFPISTMITIKIVDILGFETKVEYEL